MANRSGPAWSTGARHGVSHCWLSVGAAHGSGLGLFRWVVERTIAWYHGMKRLRMRWERRDDIHEAFLDVATCIITFRHVIRLC
jgi:hypothetical protein